MKQIKEKQDYPKVLWENDDKEKDNYTNANDGEKQTDYKNVESIKIGEIESNRGILLKSEGGDQNAENNLVDILGQPDNKQQAIQQKQEEDGGGLNNSDSDPEANTGIENGKYSKFVYDKAMNFEYTLLYFAMTQIGLSIIYQDIDRNQDIYGQDNSVGLACIWLIFVTSAIQFTITILRYQTVLQLEKEQLKLTKRETLYTSGHFKALVFEISIIFLQPYPFLTDLQVQTFDYYDGVWFNININQILTLLMLCRTFIIVRVLLKRTSFINPRADRLCRMYGCEANYNYVVKCLFVDYPMTLITVVFFVSLAFFAYGLMILESPLMVVIEENTMDFSKIENCLWLVIITMTTVGYGDYYAKTLFGRIWTILCAIWGIFVVSCLVVVLTNMLQLDGPEKKSLTVINRLQVRRNLRERAAYLLTGITKHKFIERRRNKAGIKLTTQYFEAKSRKIKKYTDQFKIINRTIKNMFDKDNIYEEMVRQFEFIRDDITNLNKNQKKLCEYIESNFNLGNYIQDKDQKETQQQNDENNNQEKNVEEKQ